MRPAVYASVMRNRKSGARRVYPTPHVFSWQRFFVMLVVGAFLFIPGLIVTIIGIEYSDNLDEIPGDRVLYKFIGPASLAIGVCLISASGIYYCCWGVQSPVSSSRARATVPTISNERNAKSPYSSVRSHGSSPSGHDGHTSSAPNTPNQRSGRHNSGTNRHRSSSQSSTHSSRNHSHHNSRHRNTSQTHNSQHSHNAHHSPTSHIHRSSQNIKDNQVPFVHTSAPLAQGETGFPVSRLTSMDISIDIDNVDDDKKY